jgi:Uma2 family endonuclease
LVIEIANSSLKDDLGMKRLLYENLGIEEYWIVDVQATKIIAFAIADGGSKRISRSLVLPDLEINILENALQKTRQENHSKVGAWLLQIFQT